MKKVLASFLSVSLLCGMLLVLTGCPSEKDKKEKTVTKEKITDTAKEKDKVTDTVKPKDK